MNWYEHLKKGLENQDYFQSSLDPCAFYRHDSVILVYVDACIVLSKTLQTFDESITSMKTGPQNIFSLTKV